jgi:biopolymer transport protein ExbB
MLDSMAGSFQEVLLAAGSGPQKMSLLDSIADFFQKGGSLMFVNLFTSMVVVALIADRTNSLFFRNKLNREAFITHVLRLVQGNRLSEAVNICRQSSDSALARVVLSGLNRADKGGAAINAAIEAAMLDASPELKKRIPILWSLANIATLIGLIGTIIGLIGAFSAIGSPGVTPEARQQILSDGISHAMNNTAFGLSIAVACMIAHVFLSGRSKAILEDMERYSLQLENALVFRDQQAQGS